MKKDLKELYREYAILHRQNTISGNYRKTNKAYDKLTTLYKKIELEYNKIEKQNFYKSLLNDENTYVKMWAASHCLGLNLFIKESLKILEEISQNNNIYESIRFTAKMTLETFKKQGYLKFY